MNLDDFVIAPPKRLATLAEVKKAVPGVTHIDYHITADGTLNIIVLPVGLTYAVIQALCAS